MENIKKVLIGIDRDAAAPGALPCRWWVCETAQPLGDTVWPSLKMADVPLFYDPALPRLGLN